MDRIDVAVAQRIIKFRGKPTILNNYFLKYWIMAAAFQGDLQTYATGSTALGIKSSKLNYLKLLLLPISEQVEIVNYIETERERVAMTIQMVKQEIELLTEYRSALISEVVTGKLQVR